MRAGRALTAVGRRLPSWDRGRVVVLCYHSIHPTLWSACASPDLFEEHLRWLSSECDCVLFSEIHRRATSPSRGRPVVAVTFDDGYADNHEIAMPLLQKWKVPATFFVTSGLIDMDAAVVDRFRFLYEGRSADEWRPMTWSQVRELIDVGMEIGSHTYRHPNLALLPADQVRAELRRSKEQLEDRLGLEAATLAYPFGKPRRHVTPEVTRMAGEAGFRFAGSVLHRGVRAKDSPLQIPRFVVVDDPVEKLEARIRGAFDIVGLGQERGPQWAGKLISPEDFRFGT